MLSNEDLINNWNNAPGALFADMLTSVFRKLETPEHVAVHNYVMIQVERRLGKYTTEFQIQVAELIKQLSLRNLTDGQKEKTKNKRHI